MEKSPGHFWEIFWSSTSNKLPSVTTSTLRGLTPSCCNQRDPAATLVFARMQPSPCTGTRGRWDEGRGGWRLTTNTFTFFYSSLCIRQRFVGCKPHSPYNTSIFWLGLLSQSLSIAFPYRNTLCMCFASWVKIDRYNSSAALTGRLRKKNAIILLVYLKNMQEIALLTSACLLIGYLLPEKKGCHGTEHIHFPESHVTQGKPKGHCQALQSSPLPAFSLPPCPCTHLFPKHWIKIKFKH